MVVPHAISGVKPPTSGVVDQHHQQQQEEQDQTPTTGLFCTAITFDKTPTTTPPPPVPPSTTANGGNFVSTVGTFNRRGSKKHQRKGGPSGLAWVHPSATALLVPPSTAEVANNNTKHPQYRYLEYNEDHGDFCFKREREARQLLHYYAELHLWQEEAEREQHQREEEQEEEQKQSRLVDARGKGNGVSSKVRPFRSPASFPKLVVDELAGVAAELHLKLSASSSFNSSVVVETSAPCEQNLKSDGRPRTLTPEDLGVDDVEKRDGPPSPGTPQAHNSTRRIEQEEEVDAVAVEQAESIDPITAAREHVDLTYGSFHQSVSIDERVVDEEESPRTLTVEDSEESPPPLDRGGQFPSLGDEAQKSDDSEPQDHNQEFFSAVEEEKESREEEEVEEGEGGELETGKCVSQSTSSTLETETNTEETNTGESNHSSLEDSPESSHRELPSQESEKEVQRGQGCDSGLPIFYFEYRGETENLAEDHDNTTPLFVEVDQNEAQDDCEDFSSNPQDDKSSEADETSAEPKEGAESPNETEELVEASIGKDLVKKTGKPGDPLIIHPSGEDQHPWQLPFVSYGAPRKKKQVDVVDILFPSSADLVSAAFRWKRGLKYGTAFYNCRRKRKPLPQPPPLQTYVLRVIDFFAMPSPLGGSSRSSQFSFDGQDFQNRFRLFRSGMKKNSPYDPKSPGLENSQHATPTGSPKNPTTTSAEFRSNLPEFLKGAFEDEPPGGFEGPGDESKSAGKVKAAAPTEAQMVLLCLDYLRGLRRNQDGKTEKSLESLGLDEDYLTVAIYALSRSLKNPDQLRHQDFDLENKENVSPSGLSSSSTRGNDPWFDAHAATKGTDPLNTSMSTAGSASRSGGAAGGGGSTVPEDVEVQQSLDGAREGFDVSVKIRLPSVEEMSREILFEDAEKASINDSEEANEDAKYEYDDFHYSNSHRFYRLNGLSYADGPLSLPEITLAGLNGLGARSRIEAEHDMVRSPLFEQFVSAVRSRGFFRDVEEDEEEDDDDDDDHEAEVTESEEGSFASRRRRRLRLAADQLSASRQGSKDEKAILEQKERKRVAAYEEKYRKVISKFRSKLAHKLEQQKDELESQHGEGNVSPRSAAANFSPKNFAVSSAVERQRSRNSHVDEASAPATKTERDPPSSKYDDPPADDNKNNEVLSPPRSKAPVSVGGSPQAEPNHLDLDEAEKLKATGNAYMQNKEYNLAAESYTAALKLVPAGPMSHVYFSNRAAALLSMKKYDDAVLDSERSLALKPDYGKAHARLGLAHFLLGNYSQAVDAYQMALELEPDNKTSKGYLEKAKKKLQARYALEEKEASNSVSAAVAESYVAGGDDNDSLFAPPPPAKTQRAGYIGSSPALRDDASVASSVMPSDEVGARQALIDQKEADKLKSAGNTYMAAKEYQNAINAYSSALRLCPAGPSSHVYFSNRAAALCYLERYEEAELDAERSLALRPDYGKAHARLGLARFFLADYEGAIEAYESALEFDPHNAASRSYLEKAKAKLAKRRKQEQQKAIAPSTTPTSEMTGTGSAASDEPIVHDPAMVEMAQNLMKDPELFKMAKSVMADPAAMEALLHAVNSKKQQGSSR